MDMCVIHSMISQNVYWKSFRRQVCHTQNSIESSLRHEKTQWSWHKDKADYSSPSTYNDNNSFKHLYGPITIKRERMLKCELH